jgi:disulfide bond formation protein DsbB
MSKRVYRWLQGLLLLSTILILWAAFYFQFARGLQPCPLCIMQRYCALLFGMCAMMGLRLSTRSRGKVVGIFQMLFAAAGLFFALRQVWLQSLPPDQIPACLPGLDVLIHYFPWHDILFALFWGTGECAEITWRLFGFSMPVWSAFYFLTMFLASGVLIILLNRSLARQDHH